jgi:hydroxylamine dehydrogenase
VQRGASETAYAGAGIRGLPEDPQWAADRALILQALGVLDPEGQPTARLDVVKGADVARLTQEDWDREREKMIATCGACHSENFARASSPRATT